MIGHYLLSLTPEQEDRVLTRDFTPFWAPRTTVCFVMVATATGDASKALRHRMWHTLGSCGQRSPAAHYEGLTYRFGTERINRIIRNRILRNRLWREMSQPTFAESRLCDLIA